MYNGIKEEMLTMITVQASMQDIPEKLSQQSQQSPLSQQIDSCWSETWPLSSTAGKGRIKNEIKLDHSLFATTKCSNHSATLGFENPIAEFKNETYHHGTL